MGEDLDEGSEENMNVYQADEGSEDDMNRDQADDDAIIVDDDEGSGKRASPVDVDAESDDDGAGAGAAVKTKTKRAPKPKAPPGHHRGGAPRFFYSYATTPTCDAADARTLAQTGPRRTCPRRTRRNRPRPTTGCTTCSPTWLRKRRTVASLGSMRFLQRPKNMVLSCPPLSAPQ